MTLEIEKLLEIKELSDIKSLEIIRRYEDDHLQCMDCKINGIDISFNWYDHLGFVEYYKDSSNAFNDLKSSIETSVAIALDEASEK